MSSSWEVVIGMEVHVQPRTRSKMFCGCAIAPLNAEPNTHVCEVCLGLPGVLPVPNKAAVEACLKTALALNCEIPRHTKFDRKNYMYPDLPKGYQISQYDLPMSVNGYLELGGRRVRIRRVHLEEDTGKLIHAGDKLHKAWESYVDLNRAGVPLMEIVSEPDLRSADEARDYAMELRTLLRTVGASEADMEKGQLRAEPNISIRRAGSEELGVKTELKNINSFRALHRAILYEVERQREVLESGGKVVQETRGWSEPLELDRAWVEELRAALPELPAVRRARLAGMLPVAVAQAIGGDRDLADLYDTAIANGGPPVSTANWIVNEIAPTMKLPSGENLAELVKLVDGGRITRDQGREVLLESVESGRTPAEIAADRSNRPLRKSAARRLSSAGIRFARVQSESQNRGVSMSDKRELEAQVARLTALVEEMTRRVARLEGTANSPRLDGVRSRRDLLKLGGVAALGAVGAAALRAAPVVANTGDNVVAGQANNADATTSLSGSGVTPPINVLAVKDANFDQAALTTSLGADGQFGGALHRILQDPQPAGTPVYTPNEMEQVRDADGTLWLSNSQGTWRRATTFEVFPNPRRVYGTGVLLPIGAVVQNIDATKQLNLAPTGVPAGAVAAWCAVQSIEPAVLSIYPAGSPDPHVGAWGQMGTAGISVQISYMMVPLNSSGRFSFTNLKTKARIYFDVWGYLSQSA